MDGALRRLLHLQVYTYSIMAVYSRFAYGFMDRHRARLGQTG